MTALERSRGPVTDLGWKIPHAAQPVVLALRSQRSC